MIKKEAGRVKRHQRLRKKVAGTSERPRVSVHRSLKNIYVQAIDDLEQKTLLAGSTRDEGSLQGAKGKTNAAKQLGLTIPQWTLMKADKVIK